MEKSKLKLIIIIIIILIVIFLISNMPKPNFLDYLLGLILDALGRKGKGGSGDEKGKDKSGEDEKGKGEDEKGKGEDEKGKGEDEKGKGKDEKGKGESGESGTGESGTGESGTGESGTGEGGTGESGTGQGGTGESGTGQGGTGESGTSATDAAAQAAEEAAQAAEQEAARLAALLAEAEQSAATAAERAAAAESARIAAEQAADARNAANAAQEAAAEASRLAEQAQAAREVAEAQERAADAAARAAAAEAAAGGPTETAANNAAKNMRDGLDADRAQFLKEESYLKNFGERGRVSSVGETSGMKISQFPGSKQSHITSSTPDAPYDPIGASGDCNLASQLTEDASDIIKDTDSLLGTKAKMVFTRPAEALTEKAKLIGNAAAARDVTALSKVSISELSIAERGLFVRSSTLLALEFVGNVLLFGSIALMIYQEVGQWRKQKPLGRAKILVTDALEIVAPFYVIEGIIQAAVWAYTSVDAALVAYGGIAGIAASASASIVSGATYVLGASAVANVGIASTFFYNVFITAGAYLSSAALSFASTLTAASPLLGTIAVGMAQVSSAIAAAVSATLLPGLALLAVVAIALVLFNIIESAKGAKKRRREREKATLIKEDEIKSRLEYSNTMQQILSSDVHASPDFLSAYNKNPPDLDTLKKYVGVWDEINVTYHMTYYLSLTPQQMIDVANNNNNSAIYMYSNMAREFIINEYMDINIFYTDGELEEMAGGIDPYFRTEFSVASIKDIYAHYYDSWNILQKDFAKFYQDGNGNWGYIIYKYADSNNTIYYTTINNNKNIRYIFSKEYDTPTINNITKAFDNFYTAIQYYVGANNDPIARGFNNETMTSIIGPNLLITNAYSAVVDKNFRWSQYTGNYLNPFVDFVNRVADIFVIRSKKYGLSSRKTIRFFVSKQGAGVKYVQSMEFNTIPEANNKFGSIAGTDFKMNGFFRYLLNEPRFTSTMISPRLLDAYAYLYDALIGKPINPVDIIGSKYLNVNSIKNYINFNTISPKITSLYANDNINDKSTISITYRQLNVIANAGGSFNQFLYIWSLSTDPYQPYLLACILGYIYATSDDYAIEKTIINPIYLYIWNNIGNNIPYDSTLTPTDYPYSLNYIPFGNTIINGSPITTIDKYTTDNILCQGNLDDISKLCSTTSGCVGFSAKVDGCADLFSSSKVDPGLINNNSNQNYLYSYYNLVQPGKPSPGYSGILNGNPRYQNL